MLRVSFPLHQILLPHFLLPWPQTMRTNRLHLIFVMAVDDFGWGMRRRRRTMRIELLAGAMRSEFGDVKDRMNRERGREIELVSERGDFPFDRKRTDETSGEFRS